MAEWTKKQREAIYHQGGNLLVKAAAGSGKTSVLVEHIMWLISDAPEPIDVDRLLVVTFTDAAAGEMRSRLRSALGELRAASPEGAGRARLGRQMGLLDLASISTFHSFCLRLIRPFFHRLNLDPAFRLLDEGETRLLQEDALEEAFLAHYADAGEDGALFLELVDAYGEGRGDEGLKATVARLYTFSRSLPEPQAWLGAAAESFGRPLIQQGWFGAILELVDLRLVQAMQLLAEGERLATLPGGPGAYVDPMAAERERLATIREMIPGGGWETMREAVRGFSFTPRLPSVKATEADPQIKERAGKARDGAKRIIESLAEEIFALGIQEQEGEIRDLGPGMKLLVRLVEDYGICYGRLKGERGGVDFSDLEQMALKLLWEKGGPTSLATQLGEKYREILVDEYQDVNQVQETIIGALANPQRPNLFLVGDEEQAIYGFRLADPSLIRDKTKLYGGGEKGRLVDLRENFRSRLGVVSAVNHLFREERLVYAAAYPQGEMTPVEVRLLDTQAGDEEENTSAAEREARFVAGRILELKGGPVWEAKAGAYRDLRYGDMVILLRSDGGRGETFARVLGEGGIPVRLTKGRGFLGTKEVRTMVAFLKVLDNPRQDIPLAAVLHSPLMGLTSAELLRIREGHPGGDFYTALTWAAVEGGSDLAESLGVFLKKLEQWRTMARRGPLDALLLHIYQETGYLDAVAALPGGDGRQANLWALYDRAREFGRFTRQGLFRFRRFLGSLQEGGFDPGRGDDGGAKADAVRIMTVHGSKGLEFPVVFLAGLGTAFNLRELNGEKLLLHRQLGLGPRVAEGELRLSYPSLAQRAIRHRLEMERVEEERRIFYVALTRARERLVLVGSARLDDDLFARWAAKGMAKCPLDWLGSALTGWGKEKFSVTEEVYGSRWEVKMEAEGGPWLRKEVAAAKEVAPIAEDADPRTWEAKFAWRYPFAGATGLPAKVAASQLGEEGRAQAGSGSFATSPRLAQGEGVTLSGAARGTITHQVLRWLELGGELTPEAIRGQVEGMVARGVLSKEEEEAADGAAIGRFFASPLGRRLVEGKDRLLREAPFTLAVPAQEVYGPEAPSGEMVLVQGIIDCLLEEEDGFLLLDFKTDRKVAPEKYRSQMNWYKRAVETARGRPVKEVYLYYLAAGVAQRLD